MRLGIDLGGTTISAGLVQYGSLRECITGPSFEKNASLEQTIEHLCAFIGRLFSPNVESIGIGVPSVVDTKQGIVYDTANIPSWKEVHLKDILQQRFNVPVQVNNDANCYALGASSVLGCNESSCILAGVTLGTGVGVGIVSGGRIFNGANTGAGELFWLPFKGNTLEHCCSKGFFMERNLNPKELSKKAEEGDPEALAIFKEFGENLASLADIVLSAYDPRILVFGGGLANTAKWFEPHMKAEMERTFPYPNTLKNLKIRYLPDETVAIIGASLL